MRYCQMDGIPEVRTGPRIDDARPRVSGAVYALIALKAIFTAGAAEPDRPLPACGEER